MPEWDATTFDAKDNLLRVVRHEADRFFALAQGAWEAPTACPKWQVRDLVGHIIDVTESYFVGFDAARSGAAHPDAFGTRAMQSMLDEGAKAHRELSQAEAVERLQGDFAKLSSGRPPPTSRPARSRARSGYTSAPVTTPEAGGCPPARPG